MGMNKGENDLPPRDQGLWVALLELALKESLTALGKQRMVLEQ